MPGPKTPDPHREGGEGRGGCAWTQVVAHTRGGVAAHAWVGLRHLQLHRGGEVHGDDLRRRDGGWGGGGEMLVQAADA